MTDVETLVSDAQAKGTFDVLAAAKGRQYPEDDTVVYLDSAAAYRFNALEDTDENKKQRDALKKDIEASGLTFHMRGVSPGFVQGLLTKANALFPAENDEETPGNSTERVRWFENALWVEHVVNVTNAAGEIDEHRWTLEEVEDFRSLIPAETDEKIMELINNLSFAAAYFDAAVSADFS